MKTGPPRSLWAAIVLAATVSLFIVGLCIAMQEEAVRLTATDNGFTVTNTTTATNSSGATVQANAEPTRSSDGLFSFHDAKKPPVVAERLYQQTDKHLICEINGITSVALICEMNPDTYAYIVDICTSDACIAFEVWMAPDITVASELWDRDAGPAKLALQCLNRPVPAAMAGTLTLSKETREV